jgi:hypothetical protein
MLIKINTLGLIWLTFLFDYLTNAGHYIIDLQMIKKCRLKNVNKNKYFKFHF